MQEPSLKDNNSWTELEETILMKRVPKYGFKKWLGVKRILGIRLQQCKDRWVRLVRSLSILSSFSTFSTNFSIRMWLRQSLPLPYGNGVEQPRGLHEILQICEDHIGLGQF
ncbi:unnamed protein product [Prunus brigantina]